MSELVEKKTIGEVEHIVHGSGQWDGTGPVEFSNDGETWAQAWTPSEDHAHPEFARVEVYRKDVRIPTTVTIRWAEQFPAASEQWSQMWTRSPMRHFGRTARMVGFRQTFRELLGDIVIEDEADDRAEPWTAEAEAAPVARDWAAEIAEAQSAELLEEIHAEGMRLRIFKPTPEGTALDRALKARRKEIKAMWADAQSAWDTPAIAESVDVPEAVASVPDEAVVSVAEAVERARRTPTDHLPPANRAARRKAARKKGGRR